MVLVLLAILHPRLCSLLALTSSYGLLANPSPAFLLGTASSSPSTALLLTCNTVFATSNGCASITAKYLYIASSSILFSMSMLPWLSLGPYSLKSISPNTSLALVEKLAAGREEVAFVCAASDGGKPIDGGM
jgi:hypothetical protein